MKCLPKNTDFLKEIRDEYKELCYNSTVPPIPITARSGQRIEIKIIPDNNDCTLLNASQTIQCHLRDVTTQIITLQSEEAEVYRRRGIKANVLIKLDGNEIQKLPINLIWKHPSENNLNPAPQINNCKNCIIAIAIYYTY